MTSFFKNCKRVLACSMATMLSAIALFFGNPAIEPAFAGNGVNVIIMIGDGMGWNMARAVAVAKGAPFYTDGKGSGLAMQTLANYGLVTTFGTTIQGSNGVKLTGNSALDGTNSVTALSPVRSGFSFDTNLNPGTRLDGLTDAAACSSTPVANPNTNNRYGYTFLERAPNATQTLLNVAATIDPNTGGKLFGLYGARGQDGNIPVSSSKGDYSLTGLGQFTLYSSVVKTAATAARCASGKFITASTNECVPVIDGSGNPISPNIPKPDTVRPLAAGETDASFIAREINENPTLSDMTQAALTVLGKDPDGFWLMVEGGDIDWGAHDNNMDNLIGTVNDFDKAVQTTINWIDNNGGWSKNLLLVTADHDHYLTLNPDFASKLTPQVAAKSGGLAYNAKDITFNKHNPTEAGHFWGSEPTQKYLWGTHSRRPVPIYFQGVYSSQLVSYLGQPIVFNDTKGATYTVPGQSGLVDQSQVFQTMKTALTSP